MEKIVAASETIITGLELDGTECAVKFSTTYTGFEVKNNSGSDITVSLHQGRTSGDGVATVPTGSGINYMHGQQLDTVYITGNGSVDVAAKRSPHLVFPTEAKGGVKKSDFDALSQNVDDISDDVDLLESRFDNAISAITTDTEVTDIRVGADGTTYQTAGEAVRGQVGELKEYLVDLGSSIYQPSNVGINVKNIDNSVEYKNYNVVVSDTNIRAGALDGYNSVCVIPTKDCEIYVNEIVSETEYFAITIGKNYSGTDVHSTYTDYLCMSATRYRNTENNLPTINNKLSVKRGDILFFTVKSNENHFVVGLDDVISSSFTEKLDNVSIQYVNEDKYLITFGKYTLELFHTKNTERDQDNWNIGNIMSGDSVLVPSGTDIIGPIKINGENDFIGGVHGSSTTTNIAIYCDGERVYRTNKLFVSCKKITIYLIDRCRKVSDKSDVFDRYVTIEITNNKIHIKNLYKNISNSTVSIERATNGGLLAVRNNILQGLSMNNIILTEAPTTADRSYASKNNVSATLCTSLGSIRIENIVGKENSTYLGFMSVFVNENPIRTKLYFDTVRNVIVANDGEISGEFEYIFN